MSKQLTSQRLILKINSSRIKDSNWNLRVSFKEALANEEIVSLGDSQALEFIRIIEDKNYSEYDIKNTKREIKLAKNDDTLSKGKKRDKINKLYDKLHKMIYIDSYVAITFQTKGDFRRATSKKGFCVNGYKYKRVVGTTGGIKNNTVIFCKECIWKDLDVKLNNNRNKDIPIVPAKLEAYKALSCSASNIVTTDYWTKDGKSKILVIKDGITEIEDKVIKISDNGKYEDYNVDLNEEGIINYKAKKEFCDGCGMISPEESERWAIKLGLFHYEDDIKVADYIPSGFNTRFAFEKGMLGTFDFKMFAREVAKTNIVVDVWGNKHDINDIEIIITTNMLKLWNAYNSVEEYLKACERNGYELRVTKICPEELELKRNMNYQYLQSYEFTDDDIKELCSETVNNIKDVLGGDISKSILFSKGVKITKKSLERADYDFIQALSIDKNVLGDGYVKNKLYRMIQKRIQDAKKGVIQVNGSYAIILGDLYALCQSMFGMEITGLLKKNEFYSRTWSDRGRDEIISFRSPMTSHNNISRKKLVDNEKVRKWFKYIKTMTIFNAWDTTTDRMNGADFDSDAEIETDNEVLLRTTRDTFPIICEQRSVEKVKVTESLLKLSNLNGFGNEVGGLTNKVTTMFELLPTLEKGSYEWKELNRRILCGQALQQEEIDKIKGIKAKPMPKSWYNYKINKIEDSDSDEIRKIKESNLKIVVNKKPYFFIYNYKELYDEYRSIMKDADINSRILYNMSVEDLRNKENKTEDEEYFIKTLNYNLPVFYTPSTMNRICWYIKNEFSDTKKEVKQDNDDFDCNIYKTDKKYTKKVYDDLFDLFKSYKKKRKGIILSNGDDGRKDFIRLLKLDCLNICTDEEILCNAIIDIAYRNKQDRQFAWDLCGEQIIKNLLSKNDNKYTVPMIDENGDIEWNGLKFNMEEIKIC